jgi:serine/threonine protein kinase
MGDVFLARTPWRERPVAALKRSRVIGDDLEERFRHELALSVRLDHPHLIPAYDAGMIGDQLYVCSELILGRDLGRISAALAQQGQGGPLVIAVSLLLDALSALHYVHYAREIDGSPLCLVHRDIKPGNIILGYDGLVRIADFGVAKSMLSADLELTKPGEVIGTPNTVAPDAIRNLKASPASDIYALGASMYRFLAGIHPHQGKTTRDVLISVLFSDARPLGELRPDLPTWFVDLIHRMLANDERKRPTESGAISILQSKIKNGSAPPTSHSAVGRWLVSLFEQEHEEEVAERERIAKMDIELFDDPGEETRMIARRGSLSSLIAEPPDSSLATDVDILQKDILLEIESRETTDRTSIGPPPPPKSTAVSHIPPDLLAASVVEEDNIVTTTSGVAPKIFDSERTQPDSGATRAASAVVAIGTEDPTDAGEKPEAATIPRTSAQPPQRRRTVLIGAFVIASTIGVTFGLIIESRVFERSATTRIITTATMLPRPLSDRLERARHEMHDRSRRNEAVPTEAWMLLDEIWSAARDGNPGIAESKLLRLEALLAGDQSR